MSRQSKVGFVAPPPRYAKSSTSRVGGSKSKSSCEPCKSSEGSRKGRFNMPALSILPKKPALDPVLERLKRKTIRRNAPEGEDMKKIREVIRGLHNEVITVQEFVGLISPYTGDNGNVLRNVMGEDLASFRKMAKRVYDTMTQDVSDVLANEQINLTDYYSEKYSIYLDKMMRTIDQIYQYAPNFDFDLYYGDTEAYLNKLFPLAATSAVALDPEEEESQRRQEAYHRLQWLRSEGTRLAEENEQLQARLKELKREQQDELMTARKQEELAEVRKTHLEATQADLQDQLEELNESVEKSLIATEESLRLTEEANVKKQLSKKHMAKQQQRASRSLVRPPSRSSRSGEPWNVKTAKALEEDTQVKSATSNLSSVSIVTTSSKGGGVKKTRTKIKFKRPPPQKRDGSPFHFSPIKTPPPKQERERSPFHFSPIKTPPPQQQRERSPFHYSPPRTPPPSQRSSARGPSPVATVRVESSATVVEQPGQPSRQLPTARRNRAPRDTWGGYG